MSFTNSATAGNGTFITTGATALGTEGGLIEFHNMSTAGSGTFTNNGATNAGGGGANIKFFDTASAGNASFANHAGTIAGAFAGRVDFFNNAKAGTASFTNDGGATPGAIPSVTDFHNTSSADHSSITSNGGTAAGAAGGQVDFLNSSQADNATLTANAGTVAGAFNAFTIFFATSAANNATLIANGGLGQGGGIYLFDKSTGDTSRVEVFGNGFLDISDRDAAASNVFVGSIEGSGNIFLGSHTLIAGGNNLNTTFSGVMQDGGESGGTGGKFIKEGTGTLILSGNNTYTGSTRVTGGTLQLDGSTASSSVMFVENGATLTGTGTNGSDILNFANVSPGHSAGTLSSNGSYTQFTGGTLHIEIGGTTPGTHDLLQIAGSSTLAGTLNLLQINNFHPLSGDRVTIITDPGGHGGVFTTVTDNFAGLVQPIPQYDHANEIYVIFQLTGSFASQALTPNQKSVAHNLDDAANDPAAAPLIGFLGSELPGNLPHDYDLIAPEELASIYEVGFSQAVVQNNNLQRRMDDIRAGSNGFCANNFVARTSGKDFSKDAGGKVVLDQKQGPEVYIPTENNRWGVFINGSGDFVNVGDDDINAPGYHITTGDFTFGADYRVCDHFAVGINGGYGSSQADLVNDGRVEVDGGKIGAYATVFGKGFFGGKIYIDGAVGGGLNSYDTLRTGLQDELVRGDTNGSEFNAMISYGSDWTFGCFNIGTWSTFQYTNVNIDKFTEEGSLAPLEIQDQGEDSIRGTSGLRASYDIKAGRTLLRPEIRAAWQHEYGDPAYQVDSRLASGAGGIFRVRGPVVGRDAALVGAGLNVQWNNRVSTYVYYDGVLGRANYDNNAVTGGLRVGF
jgi:outer membrane autotransporter protein